MHESIETLIQSNQIQYNDIKDTQFENDFLKGIREQNRKNLIKLLDCVYKGEAPDLSRKDMNDILQFGLNSEIKSHDLLNNLENTNDNRLNKKKQALASDLYYLIDFSQNAYKVHPSQIAKQLVLDQLSLCGTIKNLRLAQNHEYFKSDIYTRRMAVLSYFTPVYNITPAVPSIINKGEAEAYLVEFRNVKGLDLLKCKLQMQAAFNKEDYKSLRKVYKIQNEFLKNHPDAAKELEVLTSEMIKSLYKANPEIIEKLYFTNKSDAEGEQNWKQKRENEINNAEGQKAFDQKVKHYNELMEYYHFIPHPEHAKIKENPISGSHTFVGKDFLEAEKLFSRMQYEANKRTPKEFNKWFQKNRSALKELLPIKLQHLKEVACNMEGTTNFEILEKNFSDLQSETNINKRYNLAKTIFKGNENVEAVNNLTKTHYENVNSSITAMIGKNIISIGFAVSAFIGICKTALSLNTNLANAPTIPMGANLEEAQSSSSVNWLEPLIQIFKKSIRAPNESPEPKSLNENFNGQPNSKVPSANPKPSVNPNNLTNHEVDELFTPFDESNKIPHTKSPQPPSFTQHF